MFAGRTNWNLAVNRLSEVLAQHRAAGKPLLDLTSSNPTECGFSYDGEAILSALCNPSSLAYNPDPRGLETARNAVATYYADREIFVPAQNILLTTSTSEAYSFVFRCLCDPGDEILIPEPSYPLLDFLADIQDVKLLRYPLLYDHGWQIDFHEIEKALTPRTRGIVAVHPNNPTGQFTKSWEMARLNEICSSRQMALIADEVFLDFSLGAKAPFSFASNGNVLTFTLSGLSKIAGLPQMKVAWLIVSGPEDLRSQALARLEVIADSYLSLNTPVQLAVPAFLNLRHAFHRQLMARLRNNLAEFDLQLSRQPSCSRLEIEGGWYCVLRVPATRPDEDLAVELLATKGVCVHPGHFYDFASDGVLVLSLITPEPIFSEGTRLLLSMF